MFLRGPLTWWLLTAVLCQARAAPHAAIGVPTPTHADPALATPLSHGRILHRGTAEPSFNAPLQETKKEEFGPQQIVPDTMRLENARIPSLSQINGGKRVDDRVGLRNNETKTLQPFNVVSTAIDTKASNQTEWEPHTNTSMPLSYHNMRGHTAAPSPSDVPSMRRHFHNIAFLGSGLQQGRPHLEHPPVVRLNTTEQTDSTSSNSRGSQAMVANYFLMNPVHLSESEAQQLAINRGKSSLDSNHTGNELPSVIHSHKERTNATLLQLHMMWKKELLRHSTHHHDPSNHSAQNTVRPLENLTLATASKFEPISTEPSIYLPLDSGNAPHLAKRLPQIKNNSQHALQTSPISPLSIDFSDAPPFTLEHKKNKNGSQQLSAPVSLLQIDSSDAPHLKKELAKNEYDSQYKQQKSPVSHLRIDSSDAPLFTRNLIKNDYSLHSRQHTSPVPLLQIDLSDTPPFTMGLPKQQNGPYSEQHTSPVTLSKIDSSDAPPFTLRQPKDEFELHSKHQTSPVPLLQIDSSDAPPFILRLPKHEYNSHSKQQTSPIPLVRIDSSDEPPFTLGRQKYINASYSEQVTSPVPLLEIDSSDVPSFTLGLPKYEFGLQTKHQTSPVPILQIDSNDAPPFTLALPKDKFGLHSKQQTSPVPLLQIDSNDAPPFTLALPKDKFGLHSKQQTSPVPLLQIDSNDAPPFTLALPKDKFGLQSKQQTSPVPLLQIDSSDAPPFTLALLKDKFRLQSEQQTTPVPLLQRDSSEATLFTLEVPINEFGLYSEQQTSPVPFLQKDSSVAPPFTLGILKDEFELQSNQQTSPVPLLQIDSSDAPPFTLELPKNEFGLNSKQQTTPVPLLQKDSSDAPQFTLGLPKDELELHSEQQTSPVPFLQKDSSVAPQSTLGIPKDEFELQFKQQTTPVSFLQKDFSVEPLFTSSSPKNEYGAHHTMQTTSVSSVLITTLAPETQQTVTTPLFLFSNNTNFTRNVSENNTTNQKSLSNSLSEKKISQRILLNNTGVSRSDVKLRPNDVPVYVTLTDKNGKKTVVPAIFTPDVTTDDSLSNTENLSLVPVNEKVNLLNVSNNNRVQLKQFTATDQSSSNVKPGIKPNNVSEKYVKTTPTIGDIISEIEKQPVTKATTELPAFLRNIIHNMDDKLLQLIMDTVQKYAQNNSVDASTTTTINSIMADIFASTSTPAQADEPKFLKSFLDLDLEDIPDYDSSNPSETHSSDSKETRGRTRSRILDTLSKALNTGASRTRNELSYLAEDTSDSIVRGIEEVGERVSDIAATSWRGALQTRDTMANLLSRAVANIGNFVSNAVQDTVKTAFGTAQSVGKFIHDLNVNAMDGILNQGTAVRSLFSNTVSDLSEATNQTVQVLNRVVQRNANVLMN